MTPLQKDTIILAVTAFLVCLICCCFYGCAALLSRKATVSRSLGIHPELALSENIRRGEEAVLRLSPGLPSSSHRMLPWPTLPLRHPTKSSRYYGPSRKDVVLLDWSNGLPSLLVHLAHESDREKFGTGWWLSSDAATSKRERSSNRRHGQLICDLFTSLYNLVREINICSTY